jgi:hypothetical protein
VSTTINEDSIEVFCDMLMDAIRVNPDARPVVNAVIETLLDNNVPQEAWGTILFRCGNSWRMTHLRSGGAGEE